jgi:hypothetical protein
LVKPYPMLKQFFEKNLWYVWGGLLLAHLIAFFVQHTVWSLIPLAIIGVSAFVLTLKKLEWGLIFAFLEIFIGGHGHLFDLSVGGFSVSVRMVIFGAVMLGWFILVLQRKVKLVFRPRRDVPWILLGAAIIIGSVNGLLTNDLHNAFDDANSYLTVFYVLPLISVYWNQENRRLLLLTLTAGAVWVAFTTLLFLFGFTHLPGKFLQDIYVFVRDARLAEITILTVPAKLQVLFPNGAWYFRIFFQSQFIVLAYEIVFAAATFMVYRSKEDHVPGSVWAIHAFMLATIYASMSRSFFLGLIAAALVLILGFFLDHVRPMVIVKRAFGIGLMKLAAAIGLVLLVIFPLPIRPDFTQSLFYKGGDGADRGAAVSSRWNLLPPMMTEIRNSPIIGSGFGEEVTFVTDDPRIRATNPSGEYTTYRFEWGYQDLWLKMGFLGLLAFVAYILGLYNATASAWMKGEGDRWLSLGFGAGIIALYIVHIFSPYLNHPIGLGFMVFVLPFFSWRDTPEVEEETVPSRGTTKDALAALAKPKVGIVMKK